MFDNSMYTPYGQQPSWRPPTPMPRPNYGYGAAPTASGNIQWIRVNGAQGARDVSVPPGGEAWIMDETRPVFYLKQANAMGQAVTKAFRFEEISMEDTGSGPDVSQFVTRQEMQTITEKLANLEKFASELGGVNV